MFRPIGEVFEDKGVKLKVVEVETFFCDGCYYQDDNCELVLVNPQSKKISGQCAANYRKDQKYVIFKEV